MPQQSWENAVSDLWFFGALRLCHADSQWSGLGPGTSLDSSSPNLASTSDSSEHTLGKWEVFTSACGFHLGFQWKEYWHGELPGEYLTQVLWSQRNKLWWYFRVESWGIPEITGRNWEPKKCHKSMVCSKKWPQRLGPPALNFTRTLMQFHLGSFGFVKETTPKFTENWCFIWLYNVVYIYICI